MPNETKTKKWIPYAKEKPMAAGKYLVCGHDLKDNNRLVVSTATWVHSMYSFYGKISVLAWMPLPEPYTPEGSE